MNERSKSLAIRLMVCAALLTSMATYGFAAVPATHAAAHVAHGPNFPPDPWDGKTAHGPNFPPDPWDGKTAHGPNFPPDPWDGKVAHGPNFPPDPWDGKA